MLSRALAARMDFHHIATGHFASQVTILEVPAGSTG